MDAARTAESTQARVKLPTIRLNRALLIVGAIVLVAFGVRLMTFQRYLPLMDYGDEPNTYLLARDWRGVEDVPVIPTWLAGYPPLYVWVNMGVQEIVDAHWPYPWIFPSQYFYYTRLLAAIFGGLTTILIIALGWQLGGPIAAAFAGGVWALSPLVVDINSLALPDPLVFLCCALTLVAALQAWRSKSPILLTISLIAGIAATYAKYPAGFALLAWGLTALALLREKPRRWWHWLLLNLALGLLAFVYLVFIYGSLGLSNREAETVRGSGLAPIFDLSHELTNWYYAVLPIGAALFVGVVIIGVIAYLISRRRGWQIVHWRPLAMIALYALVGVAISTTFTYVGIPNGKMRYILPVTVGVLGLWGALISQIYWTLRDAWRSRKPQVVRWLPQAALAAAGLLVAIPLVTGGIGSVQQFHLMPTELLAQNYASDSLPSDGRMMFHPKSNIGDLFNREWSGYSGATAFDWWSEDPAGKSPQSYAQRGITYFVIEADDWQRIQDTDPVKQFVSQLTLLHTIHAGVGQFGPDISFYRMLPPQHTTDVSFGDQIRLTGYDLSASSAAPGQTITFRPYWRASSQPAINYSMFVHVYAQGQTALVTQYDGSPGLQTRLPSTWDDPNELIVGADAALTIPAQTPPGNYVIGVGLYDYVTGQRLPTPNGDTFEIPLQITKSS